MRRGPPRARQLVAYTAFVALAACILAACGGGSGRSGARAQRRLPPGPVLDPCVSPRVKAGAAPDPSVLGAGADSDGDGVSDACEQSLAEKYAPVVYHSSVEKFILANVDWYLARSEIWFFDDACLPDLHKWFIYHPSQTEIARQRFTGGCGSTDTVYSWGTRSQKKERTFYLENVGGEDSYGTGLTSMWTTYFHAYLNVNGGVTVQYWRFYPGHGGGLTGQTYSGDWEGVMIVLDRQLQPQTLGFIWRGDLNWKRPSEVEWEGSHFRVYSEPNEHGSSATASGLDSQNCQGDGVTMDPTNPCTVTRQQTWTGGLVYSCSKYDERWCNYKGRTGLPGGALLNVGEKTATMNGQDFVRYSGLWGEPVAGTGSFTDGWWGPAFFGTQMTSAGFVTAWCTGMQRDAATLTKECYPTATSR